MNGVFTDTTLFLKVLEGDGVARELFRELYRKERLYRNAVVFSELMFVWLKSITGKKSYELRKSPDILKSAILSFKKIEPFLNLSHSLPITQEIEFLAMEISAQYGLLPNDALIAATCRHYGIKKIATFDEDFEKVDFLEIIRA